MTWNILKVKLEPKKITYDKQDDIDYNKTKKVNLGLIVKLGKLEYC